MEKKVSAQGSKQEGNCNIFQVTMQEKQESFGDGKNKD